MTHTHGAERTPGGGSASAPRLRWALALTATFMFAEVAGGIIANSLALIADAGHMLTDTAALALSLFVVWFTRQPASREKTFGYVRWEILAALLNGAVLLLVSAWVLWEAALRLRTPEPLDGGIMVVVAAVGLLVNVVAAAVLHPVSDENLNVRGAYLHVLGDLLGSVGTLAAGAIVHYSGWLAADPIASAIVSLLVVRSAWRLIRESTDVLLETAPGHIDPDAVLAQIGAIAGVESVHDLHIWSVSSDLVAMSVHAVVREPERHQHVLEHVHDAMRLFGIGHVTVQLERSEMYERERHLRECWGGASRAAS